MAESTEDVGHLPGFNIMRSTAVLVLLLSFLTTGCAGYLKDRLKDASEMLDASVGISVGVDANVRATKILQAGFGSYSGDWVGLKEGTPAHWREMRAEMGISPFYYHELQRKSPILVDIRHPQFGEAGYAAYLNDFHSLTDRSFFELGITFNLIAIGGDLALDGAEVIDFLSGWFGLDVLGDDCHSRPLGDLVNRVQSADPAQRFTAVRGLRWRTGERFGYVVITSKDEHTEDQIDAWRRWKQWLATSGTPPQEKTGDG